MFKFSVLLYRVQHIEIKKTETGFKMGKYESESVEEIVDQFASNYCYSTD